MTRLVAKARLSGGGKNLDFEYNPSEISISHNAEGLSDPMGAKKGDDDRNAWSALATRGSTRLILSPLTFTGDGCQPVVKLLMDWVAQKVFDGESKSRREILEFKWGAVGKGFHYEVELVRFDCTYTRFTREGRPIRAEVRNVTLNVLGDAHGGGPGAPSGAVIDAHRGAERVPAGMDSAIGPNSDPVRSMLGGG
ncbi:hypothetical protein [Streptomyces sp. NPDC047981]|uniref:hypothetical protein n=1 Tax=Streptomyces sp. NPDC047981 TaxID=3154610 RepID=UPI00341C21C1